MLHVWPPQYYGLYAAQRTENFVATGTSPTPVELVGGNQYAAFQVVGVGGTPTTWDVRLEGSLDGTNWTQIMAHTTATGNAVVAFGGANPYPVRYVRVNVNGLTLAPATSINVYWRMT